MNEYISREAVSQVVHGIARGIADRDTEALKAKDMKAFYMAKGAKEILDSVDTDLCYIPAADVQSINPLVKVEERVPNVSGNYLCYLDNGEFEVLYFDRGIEDDEYNNDYPFGVWNTYPSKDGGECREWIEVLEVTHWQPLPEPPKGGE